MHTIRLQLVSGEMKLSTHTHLISLAALQMEFHHQASYIACNNTHHPVRKKQQNIVYLVEQPPRDPHPPLLRLLRLLGLFKGEGGGEYSETRLPLLGPVVQELVTESVATFAARHLQGRGRLLVLGDAVRSHGFRERGPRRGVLELLGTVEELVATLFAHVQTCAGTRRGGRDLQYV